MVVFISAGRHFELMDKIEEKCFDDAHGWRGLISQSRNLLAFGPRFKTRFDTWKGWMRTLTHNPRDDESNRIYRQHLAAMTMIT
jgi:hypothetical protein